ncbi:4-amino-4-deoxy-L-arabinose-phosphoundecaprenol flippase subunit ArnE [Erwinia aphidicola]|uniref:4-amino-4-deoxy-L-arabinose-phosphoundecaprenol flippase subunit ArnE n=1 Tax=Erwinia TaxID=551 RepID=UPI00105DD5A5|nr:4-amino-4-deoxy-L-arabinose-phosphoundecaprenol flippase subunit ArnE [Erwinia aphidicola]MCP2232449.1 undecaprenyl phosphate-alpha-L-ara4N flippase subunit ArnE [Erwinia aphidicola]
MNMLLILLASLLSCGGQLCQKQATVQRAALWGWLALSVLLLGLAMLVWLRVLQTTPLGVAYPMLSLNFIFVTLAARWLWHEAIPLRHALGIILIVAGVAVMGSYT